MPLGLADEEDIETGQIIPGSWRADTNTWLDLTSDGQRNASTDDKEIREEITDYCMNEGAVPWQWKSAHLE